MLSVNAVTVENKWLRTRICMAQGVRMEPLWPEAAALGDARLPRITPVFMHRRCDGSVWLKDNLSNLAL